jgi:hypothetical protein
MPRPLPTKRAPIARNEIHTNYRPTDWTDRLIIAAAVLLIIALPFIIADLIWGAEVVTEWVALLVS